MNTAVATSLEHNNVLTVALMVATAAHAVVLLGVSFSPFLENMRTPPALEVVLVENSDIETVDDASYLAQANQDGGGETEDDARPSSPFTSALDVDSDGIAPTPMAAGAPSPSQATSEEVITALSSEEEVFVEESEETQEIIEEAEAKIHVEQNVEIAKLAAEIDRQQEKFAKRPKKKFLNARTRESASAEYMYRWVESVERVGNLNYPDEARRSGLHGDLILIVGIYKNGELESVTVDESSGHKILDDAAVRTVEMASPFEPMTGKLAEETDILYIVRTWEFTTNNSIDSR
ncbi:MAG: energy transducer TonB [Granulosicoccus sp.]